MRLICPLCHWVFWLCECQRGPLVEKPTLGGRPARALGYHEPPLSDLVHRLKYGEETFLADWFAAWLARLIVTPKGPVGLVPVPLHERKLAARGYNQSALIARGLSRRVRMGLILDGVHRRRETAPQAQLPAHSREANLSDAFEVQRKLSDLQVFIVDDVVTTGATSDALASALESQGAIVLGVLAVTLARPKAR